MLADHDLRLASLILNSARDYAIFTLDLEGTITSWSPGAEAVLGYGRDEAVGMSFAMLFTSSDRVAGSHLQELARAIAEGRAEDTRWHVRKNGERFWANGMTMGIFEPELTGLLKFMRDETATKLADDQRVLLLNELNHRIKNTLATVQSITEQTLRAGGADPATRRTLTDRLIALSQAHDVLVDESWAGADLHAIVAQALAAFQRDRTAVLMDGPPVRLSAQQAVAMALALHELATNGAKYGALSTLKGRVEVTWNQSIDKQGGRHMTLLWRERDGPAVPKPLRQGFGTRLIARTFGHESGGEAHIDFHPDGVQCVLQLPLSSETEIPPLPLERPRRSGTGGSDDA